MNSDRMTVLPGPLEHNEINDLKCQPGVTAHTEPKGQFGEVSTLSVDARKALGAALRRHADWLKQTYDFGYMDRAAAACVIAAAFLESTIP